MPSSANYIDPHKFRPTGSRVLVRVDPRRTMSHGLHGSPLHLGADRDSMIGTVVAVGPGRVLPDGRREWLDIEPGDRVYLGPYNGVVLNTERDPYGYEYRICEQWKRALGTDGIPDVYAKEEP